MKPNNYVDYLGFSLETLPVKMGITLTLTLFRHKRCETVKYNRSKPSSYLNIF